MTKAQREKAERLMLKHLIDNQPKYKEIMDALIDNPDKELNDVVQPVIEEELEKSRMTGIQIGWQAAFIQAYEKIKNMNDVDEIKDCLKGEADAVREKMGLKPAFDEDGNLIVDEGEENGKSV